MAVVAYYRYFHLNELKNEKFPLSPGFFTWIHLL